MHRELQASGAHSTGIAPPGPLMHPDLSWSGVLEHHAAIGGSATASLGAVPLSEGIVMNKRISHLHWLLIEKRHFDKFDSIV